MTDENNHNEKLGECGDCGHLVSRRAIICTNCGRSFGGEPRLETIVKNFNIPFFDLMFLLVKLAVAAIPAGIIVALIFVSLTAILAARFH